MEILFTARQVKVLPKCVFRRKLCDLFRITLQMITGVYVVHIRLIWNYKQKL